MFTAGVPGGDREEDESGVGNGRVGEETLEVVLWDGGQVACQEGEAGEVRTIKVVWLRVMSEVKKGSRMRRATMKPAALEPTERKAVMGVGAPW